jgi:hypothetical protein
MVNLRCSASDRIRVPAQQTCEAGRAGVHLPSETGYTGPAEADQAGARPGARPYLRRCAGTPRERIRFN